MPDSLHMVQIHFDGKELARAEERHGLRHAPDDLGYLAHAQLAACFGDLAPKPFSVRSRRGGIEILGYAAVDADELQAAAEDFAEPVFADSWSNLDSKRLRTEWRSGRRLGFEVRVCPVVRLSSDREIPLRARKPGEETGLHTFRKGAEVDVFQRDLGEKGLDAGVTRRASYEHWLLEGFGESAEILDLEMLRFQLSTLYRRTQGKGRKGRKLKRPDVTFSGELAVGDGAAFAHLLTAGIGRHRAFGFGMLLLRPPG